MFYNKERLYNNNINKTDFFQDMLNKPIPKLIEEKKVRKITLKNKNNDTEIKFGKKFTIEI